MSIDKRSGTSTWEPADGSSKKKRRAAYNKVEQAQKHGSMPKSHTGKCAVCGKTAKLVFDHPGDNYAAAKSGRWLCRSCNARLNGGK